MKLLLNIIIFILINKGLCSENINKRVDFIIWDVCCCRNETENEESL